MWAQIEQILRQAAGRIAEHVANFLPGVVVALVMLVMTFATAAVTQMLLLRALRGLEVDRRADQWGLTGLVGWSARAGISATVARVAWWTVFVLGLLVSLTALNATIPSRFALAVFEYLPHLVAGLAILVVGAAAARFLSRSVLISAVNMQVQGARLLSLAVKWLVLVVAVAMALDHLGIGRRILLLAFGIFFGGVVLAAALAVGLGARDTVARALERQPQEPGRGGDPVNHV